jgi:hypothetical protein
MRFYTKVKIGIVLLICVALSLSCGGKVTTRTEEPVSEFTVNGVVVQDLNTGRDIAYFAILRDGNPFDSAVVKVGSDTLTNEGNGNYYLDGFPLFAHGQNISIKVSSFDDDFNLSTSVQMPGSFQITAFNPTVITSSNYHLLKVYGSASAGADGYCINFIKPDGGNGYAGLVSLIEMTQGIEDIPRETFEEGGDYRTGTYTVYIAAYKGGFPSFPEIPFYLPGDLPTGNLSGANGTIGAGVIAPSESLIAE